MESKRDESKRDEKTIGQPQKEMYTGNLFNNPRFVNLKMSDETLAEYKRYGENMYSFDFESSGTSGLGKKQKKTAKQRLREKIANQSEKPQETEEPDPVIDSVVNIMSYVRSGFSVEDLSQEEQDLLRSHYGNNWKKVIEEELNKEL